MPVRNPWSWTTLAIALAALGLAAGVGAREDAGGAEPGSESGGADAGSDRSAAETAGTGAGEVVVASRMPVFVPPNRGAPLTRLGGATRSAASGELPRIEALVPEEPGWTLEEQPVLYWHLGAETDVRVDFVLLRLDPTETLVEATLPAPQDAGVQRIALADHGARLERGVSYQWLVKLVPNPEDRSFDRIVGGGIERVAPPDGLEARLAAPGASPAHVLAEAGIWYDALDALSRRIDAASGDARLEEQRAGLLAQVGLPESVHR